VPVTLFPERPWLRSFICVTRLIHMCDTDSFMVMILPIRMYDITHLYAWHYSFICVTWLIHIRDNKEMVLKDLRWCIRHHSSVEKSAGLDKFGLSAGPRFDSGRNPVNSDQYGFEQRGPQRVLNYCFQYSQSHLGWHFRKLKARMSLLPHFTEKSCSSFETAFENVTPNGIGCNKSKWNEIFHNGMCDMSRSHSHVWHKSYICMTWLIHMCDMNHSYVWHVSFIFVTLLIHTCDIVTWLIHMCDMIPSHVWYDSFTLVTLLVHMFDMTDSNLWHFSFTLATWLIHMFICVTCMTHSNV